MKIKRVKFKKRNKDIGVSDEVKLLKNNILLQRKEEKRKRIWLKNNPVDREKVVKTWNKNSEVVKKDMFDILIRYLSISDGALKTGEMLEIGLGAQEVGIDMGTVESIQQKLMKIEFNLFFLEKTKLPKFIKDKVMERIINREFPDKISLPSTNNQSNDAKALIDAFKNIKSENPYGTIGNTNEKTTVGIRPPKISKKE